MRHTNPLVHSFSESSLAYVVQGRGNAVRPDEFVNTDVPVRRDCLFVLYAISNDQHLYSYLLEPRHTRRARSGNTHLTYICHFEHLLIVEGLLRFDDARQVDQLERIERVADVKDAPSRVYRLVGLEDADERLDPSDAPLNLNHTSLPISLD